MLDYLFKRDDGSEIPVAQMERADIEACLRGGAEVTRRDSPGENEHSIRERLWLELFIRDNNLRQE